MGKKIRDYRKEYDDYHGKPEEIARRAARNKARANKKKKGFLSRFDEVDHKDNNPQNNSPSNLRVVSRNKNRTRSHTKRSLA
ncbi:MAG: HNH endonuclease [Dehalococcoidia bacterium]|jgi:hypothetical protein|nr:HNH endonuclease [Dehalococcoidia bacterium]